MQSNEQSPEQFVGGTLPIAEEVRSHLDALKDSDISVRWRAVQALDRLGDVRAVPTLIDAFRDSDRLVRQIAVEVLGKIGVEAVLPLAAAIQDSDAWIRFGAADALGEIGDGQTLPLQVLSSATLTPAAKLDTFVALGRVGYTDDTIPSIPVYCQSLLSRTDVEDAVRAGAEAVLVEVQNRLAAEILVRASPRPPTRDASIDKAEGLRLASSIPPFTPPEQHLRASEPPVEREEEGSWVDRWFRRK